MDSGLYKVDVDDVDVDNEYRNAKDVGEPRAIAVTYYGFIVEERKRPTLLETVELLNRKVKSLEGRRTRIVLENGKKLFADGRTLKSRVLEAFRGRPRGTLQDLSDDAECTLKQFTHTAGELRANGFLDYNRDGVGPWSVLTLVQVNLGDNL